MTVKRNIPKWAYAFIVLLGPALVFGLFVLLGEIIDLMFDLFAMFPYWWAVGIGVGYLFAGAILAGLISSVGASSDE